MGPKQKTTTSRKELLSQYRQAKESKGSREPKEPKESNKENISQRRVEKRADRGKESAKDSKLELKSKMKSVANSTIAPEKQIERSSNREKIELAGRKKVAPSTPIGKLKRRIAITQKPVEAQISSTKICGIEDFQKKLLEAKFLSQSYGSKVARPFLENLKSEPGYEWIAGKAIYWLACIKLEISDRNWSRVEHLFSMADGLLEDSSDRSALAAAYEDFKSSASAVLQDKLQVLSRNTVTTPPLPLPPPVVVVAPRTEENEQEVPSRENVPTNPFQNVSVASIRSRFEKNTQSFPATDVSSLPLPPPIIEGNTKSKSKVIAQELSKASQGYLSKKLVGGIPLIGLAAPPSKVISPPEDDRDKDVERLLLGIDSLDDRDSETDIPSVRFRDQRNCLSTPIHSRHEADDYRELQSEIIAKPCLEVRGKRTRNEDPEDYQEQSEIIAKPCLEVRGKRTRNEESEDKPSRPLQKIRKTKIKFASLEESSDVMKDADMTRKLKRRGTPYKSTLPCEE